MSCSIVLEKSFRNYSWYSIWHQWILQGSNLNSKLFEILMDSFFHIPINHLKSFWSGRAAKRDLCMASLRALCMVRITGCFCQVYFQITLHHMNYRKRFIDLTLLTDPTAIFYFLLKKYWEYFKSKMETEFSCLSLVLWGGFFISTAVQFCGLFKIWHHSYLQKIDECRNALTPYAQMLHKYISIGSQHLFAFIIRPIQPQGEGAKLLSAIELPMA